MSLHITNLDDNTGETPMRNPITMLLLAIGTLFYPPLALLFIPVLIGNLIHYFRLRRIGRRR